jgi:c-di-GMP-binding flagellar brake protein YcgR
MREDPSTAADQAAVDIVEGNRCLLSFMGQHFMVDLVEVGEDSIRVTFPGRDYPVAGMPVDLEFHDKGGFNCYRSEVLEGPERTGTGIVLRRPTEPRRTQHRDTCRVPTDLTVQVKDHIHIRRYDADLVNLSAGGALIMTQAPFDFTTTVELALSLPGEPRHEMLCSVVHMNEAASGRTGDAPKNLFGLRFISPEPDVSRSITRYIWQRLRELYSDQ